MEKEYGVIVNDLEQKPLNVEKIIDWEIKDITNTIIGQGLSDTQIHHLVNLEDLIHFLYIIVCCFCCCAHASIEGWTLN